MGKTARLSELHRRQTSPDPDNLSRGALAVRDERFCAIATAIDDGEEAPGEEQLRSPAGQPARKRSKLAPSDGAERPARPEKPPETGRKHLGRQAGSATQQAVAIREPQLVEATTAPRPAAKQAARANTRKLQSTGNRNKRLCVDRLNPPPTASAVQDASPAAHSGCVDGDNHTVPDTPDPPSPTHSTPSSPAAHHLDTTTPPPPHTTHQSSHCCA